MQENLQDYTAGLLKARLSKPRIRQNLDFMFCYFSVQFSVYIVCRSVFSLNDLELHNNTLSERHFYTKKNILQFTFNPGLELTGFRTTWSRGPFCCFVFQSRGSFKKFENCTVKLLAEERKWTLSEVRTRPTFLETLISKSDSGLVKLPGLSRKGPRVFCCVCLGCQSL